MGKARQDSSVRTTHEDPESVKAAMLFREQSERAKSILLERRFLPWTQFPRYSGGLVIRDIQKEDGRIIGNKTVCCIEHAEDWVSIDLLGRADLAASWPDDPDVVVSKWVHEGESTQQFLWIEYRRQLERWRIVHGPIFIKDTYLLDLQMELNSHYNAKTSIRLGMDKQGICVKGEPVFKAGITLRGSNLWRELEIDFKRENP